MKTTGVLPVAFAFSTWSAVAVAAEVAILASPRGHDRCLSASITEARLTNWTTVYWGPVVEADVVLAALRAAGLPAELVYQSTLAGAPLGPGPMDSRVVVPDHYAREAAEIIARADHKQKQPRARTPRATMRVLLARVIAVLFLAGILWTVANIMFPGLSPFMALPF
jgi:hypothetical protein